MADYIAFDNERALNYVAQLNEFFAPNAQLTCNEFGDGNLNLVFRIADENGNSIILKQALPYARCVGESWPLTLDRARIEAAVLEKHGAVCEPYTAKVLHKNTELALTILEDLGHMAILRGELNKATPFPNLGSQIANYLATTSFHYSDFYLTPAEKKALVCEFKNPELCAITEDLFFDDPYRTSLRNNYPATLESEVKKLKQNTELHVKVAKLKQLFLSSTQSLLHGDVHSGSIFVDAQSTKVIDPEFGFFGPIGFDLGSFIGNFSLNYCAQNARISEIPKRRQMQTYLLTTIQQVINEFAATWLSLAKAHTRDLSLQAPGYAEYFVNQIIRDALGFAGTELVRRTIGLAHVSDIDGIEDDAARLQVQRQTLILGEQLILHAETAHDKESAFNLIISLVQ
ncbi:S-methyl-5-thioribose kinase [Pseudoalteromonas spongiae]|uniref:S-methyl-5-thioribose kinase n=1 Tax=Pseudoalteromonas spongiae TaxID=298657 RepID=UPI000C2CE3EA|nr:S-methyl-5-thioribose kinase [Pseudoalteromonas spongiae]TMO84873.1 S-methyl-5-thioribose kinase [Pseudoalteromonas spongiae]